MLGSADFLVFCGHCKTGAIPLVWSSDISENSVVHNVYWPHGWIGIQNKYGFYSKCQYCMSLYPPLVGEEVYYAVLVEGILTEQTFWTAPIKVGPKIEFSNLKVKRLTDNKAKTKVNSKNQTKVNSKNQTKSNSKNQIDTTKADTDKADTTKNAYVPGTSGGSNGCSNTNNGARVRTNSYTSFHRCRRRHSTGNLQPGFRNII